MGLPNEIVFANGQWQGFLMSQQHCIDLIKLVEEHADWRPREEAEQDDNWQQIYPYGLFRYQDQYLEVKRGSQTSHRRFSHKYTLGIGGHVTKQEFDQHKSLDAWIQAMFYQDIAYEGSLTTNCLGIVNDNSDDLGKYHLGIVYLLDGDNAELQKTNQQEIRLVKLNEITDEDLGYLERWSQMIYRQLRDADETE